MSESTSHAAEAQKLGLAARLVSRGDVSWYRAPALGISPDVVHGVTHRDLGNFSMVQAKEPAEVVARRVRLLESLEIPDAQFAQPALHHSSGVAVLRGGALPQGRFDAIVSDEPNVLLAVTVADCVPVFLVDVQGRAVGVAHAGWRGVVGGIVMNAIRAMQVELGIEPQDLLVGTGPSIRGPNYEVGPEVVGFFPEEVTIPTGDPGEGRARVDLPSTALAQARMSGVPPDNLIDFSLCTFSRPDDLFSHRRGDTGRHLAFVVRIED